ncbi:MAG: PseG/SpsG family protein, partial [Acidobacteriota bacterium]
PLKAPVIVFRVDGDRVRGMGHLSNCFNLALLCRDTLGAKAHFLLLQSSLHNTFVQWIEAAGFGVATVSGDQPWSEDLETTASRIEALHPDFLIADLITADATDLDLLDSSRIELPQVEWYVDWLRRFRRPVISLSHDAEPISYCPDLLVALHPLQLSMDYKDGARRLLGPRYHTPAPAFRPFRHRTRLHPQQGRHVVLAFGGSDPDQLTLRVAGALAPLPDLEITAVLGPATACEPPLVDHLRRLGARPVHAVQDLAQILWNCDLAISAGGNMVFELASLGTPAMVINIRQRQQLNTAWFASHGACIDLGTGSDIEDRELRQQLLSTLADRRRRQALSNAGRAVVDGRGGERVVAALNELAA